MITELNIQLRALGLQGLLETTLKSLQLSFWWFLKKREFLFTAALALRSRGLVIGSREKEEEKEEKEKEREEKEEEEKNLQIAIRCLWDLFD